MILIFSDEDTQRYLSDLDNMHKVVLEVGGEADLVKVAEKLKEASVDHKLWVEQPENFPTCLAVKPYPKEVMSCINIDELKKSFFLASAKIFQEIQALQRTRNCKTRSEVRICPPDTFHHVINFP